MALLVGADRVVIGPPGERIEGGAVLVEGATITAVGPRAEIERAAPSDVRRFERPGTTLVPGLVNAHVHLCFEPGVGLEDAVSGVDDRDLVLAMAGRARRLLDGGVTTARDLGDRGALSVRVREAIAPGALDGPRLLVAGAPLTPPRGHCWFLGGEVAPGDPDALRAAVRARAAQGVDLVKVMGSGGQSTAGGAQMWERQFDADDLRVVTEEATRLGLPVAVHAHGPDSIADAVAAGVTTVEHCSWMTGWGTSEFRPEVVDAMARAGVVACPGSSGQWRAMAERVGIERVRELMGRLRRMADQGVRVILGTDAGLNPFEDFARSVGNWADWGFTPAELLEMVTAGAADTLGVGDRTGRLHPGFDADLLLVDGDPLADLHALEAIAMVATRGRIHRPGVPRGTSPGHAVGVIGEQPPPGAGP